MSRSLCWLAVAAAVYVAWVGPLFLPASDTWWHLLQVHRTAAADTWLPAEPGGAIRLHAGVWHGALGQLCRATGWHPLETWTFVAPLVAAGWVFSAGFCARRLLGPGRELAGALAVLLLMNGSFINPLRELSYPRYVNLIHLMVGAGAACGWIERGAWRDLALVALCGLLMAAVHLQELVLFGLILGFALPALALGRRATFATEAPRLIAAGLVALAAAAPYLALVVLPRMVPGSDALARDVPLALRLRDTLAIGGWPLLDPGGEYGRIAGGAAIAALLALPWWWRARTGTAILSGALALPPLIVLNPGTFWLWLKVWPVPDVVHRIALVMLVPWAAIAAYDALMTRLRHPLAILLLLALAAGAWPSIALRFRDAAKPGWRAELARLEYLAPLAPVLGTQRGVALTDPYTAYHLAGLWGIEPADLGPSRAVNQDDRPRSPGYRFFRDATQSRADVATQLAPVRWIVVNRVPLAPHYELVHRDPYAPDPWLDRNPAAFPALIRATGLTLLEVTKPLPALTGKGLTPAEVLPRPVTSPPLREAGRTGPLVLYVVPAPRTVARGGILRVHTRWRFTAPSTAFFRVRMHALAAASPSPNKLGRKLHELRGGQVYRFGTDVEVSPEELQLVTRAAGDELARDIELPVPANAAPGVYRLTLEALWKPASEIRTLTLDDALPGVDAGGFTVSR